MSKVGAVHSSDAEFHRMLARTIVSYWLKRGYAASASAIQVETVNSKGESHLMWQIVSNIGSQGYPLRA